MRSDCSITWGYIVNKMEKKFGIAPDSNAKYSMGEIDKMIETIWLEFIDSDDEVTE